MKSWFDLKHNLGKITPESSEDLWILSEILHPGIMVTARTLRGTEIRRGDEKVKTGKKMVTLTVHVEKVDITDKLRLAGKIVDGPDWIDRGYHTLEIEPGTEVKVEKVWKYWERHKIKEAEKEPEPILAVILDESEADFYLVKDRYKHLLHLDSGGMGKKSGVSKQPEYYASVLAEVKKRADSVKGVVLAGTGFAREEVQLLAKQREKELLSKLILEHLNQIGSVGMQELLKKGIQEKVVEMGLVAEETNAVENALAEMVKSGRAAFGVENTKKALEAGAVELLMVSDKRVRELEDIVEKAGEDRIKLMIISSTHESGEKLLGLGGIGALLRYRL